MPNCKKLKEVKNFITKYETELINTNSYKCNDCENKEQQYQWNTKAIKLTKQMLNQSIDENNCK